MKVTRVDLSALNLPSGTHRITVRSRAVGFNDSALSNPIKYTAEGGTTETQTLIIVNQNNASEIFEFVMPMGYTFNEFVGSVYDTSGGKFTLGTSQNMPDGMRPVYFNGYLLPLDQHDQTIASGTFYYEGAAPETPETPEPPETAYELSGTWVFDKMINLNPNTEMGTLTEPCTIYCNNNLAYNITIRYTHTSSKLLSYFFDFAEDTRDVAVYYESDSLPAWSKGWQNEVYRTITFDGTQTVSKEFYDWFTSNADRQTITFTIDGTEYRALSRMTWGEWVNNSEYNTGGYVIGGNGGWNTIASAPNGWLICFNGVPMDKSYEIVDGRAYVTQEAGNGGGSND